MDLIVTNLHLKATHLRISYSAVEEMGMDISMLKIVKKSHWQIIENVPSLFEDFCVKGFNLL
jgi:hypothetical protein